MRYTYEQLKDILRRAGWSETLIPIMAAIGIFESSGDATSYRYCSGNGYCTITQGGRTFNAPEVRGQSPEKSAGLWQINLFAHKQYSADWLRDPVNNARAALAVYNKQGFGAWKKSYQKYKNSGGVVPNNGNASAVPVKDNYSIYGYNNDNFNFNDYLGVKIIDNKSRYLLAFGILVIIFIFAFNQNS